MLKKCVLFPNIIHYRGDVNQPGRFEHFQQKIVASAKRKIPQQKTEERSNEMIWPPDKKDSAAVVP